jgi:hypothetical protein
MPDARRPVRLTPDPRRALFLSPRALRGELGASSIPMPLLRRGLRPEAGVGAAGAVMGPASPRNTLLSAETPIFASLFRFRIADFATGLSASSDMALEDG